MAGNFLQGDPVAMQSFGQRAQAHAELLQAIRANRTGLVQGDLAYAFTGHGGAAAQAVNADVIDPLGRRNESRQLDSSGRVKNAAATYDGLQGENAHVMRGVTGDASGSIVDVLTQPSAKA